MYEGHQKRFIIQWCTLDGEKKKESLRCDPDSIPLVARSWPLAHSVPEAT